MESRIIVPMNLFERKEWRYRYRERTCGLSVGRRGKDIEKAALTYIHYHV